ncbi:CBS domain-containing protein [Limibaculum sp. M0105]|uniref:CBS domain-containing protein n=1 Tax=Thermohalobaculum xanthum TaxID=2753746 RepID=A0A8J7SGA2_9RHOB|nr:CBS domain-containing protein [Thermohalobaculum xanthum]MBK0400047.1 CBS domain-containing protein [Thermohalobaculum xanthum]
MNVIQILRSKGSAAIETITSDITLSDAAARLAARRIGALVVTGRDGSIAGILSERDIVRRIGEEGARALSLKVSDVMTSKVETCSPSDTAISVLERMTSGRFRHMPVMEGGKMTGILSIGDVVKARIDEVEAENQAMAGMLSG